MVRLGWVTRFDQFGQKISKQKKRSFVFSQSSEITFLAIAEKKKKKRKKSKSIKLNNIISQDQTCKTNSSSNLDLTIDSFFSIREIYRFALRWSDSTLNFKISVVASCLSSHSIDIYMVSIQNDLKNHSFCWNYSENGHEILFKKIC